MLSLSHKFLFVHIPKTGGNSIQKLLYPLSEDRIVTGTAQDGKERFEVRGRFTPHKHATLADYHKRLPPEQFAALSKFCAIRNPWSRAISFYFTPRRWIMRGCAPYWSKDHFLEVLPKLKPMVEYLKVDGRVPPLAGAVRYENLTQDLTELLDRLDLDLDPATLPHLNRSRAGDYRNYYAADPDLIGLIADRYRDDIDFFDYRFEG